MSETIKKKKLCILQNGLARGGTDTFVVNLCKGLDKSQFEVTVVNPSTRPESLVREAEVLQTGANIIHTHDLGQGFMGKIRHLKKLYQILKRGRYDIFQTNIDLFNGPNLFIAWLAGVPIRCCHSHNGMQQKSLVEGMTLAIKIYQYMMRYMCWHFSNRRCGCSSVANDFLYKGKAWQQDMYPSVVNNGIDIKQIRKGINVTEKKAELGLSAKYNIITVGRIIPQKNPLLLTRIFVELCKNGVNCELAWVGVGDMQKQCEYFLQQNGFSDKVHFLGSRSDVGEIMQCCNLFLLPSAFEGLGIVVIEAQAVGLPCVVSDAVTKEANCGACTYISLNEEPSVWANTIEAILEGEITLEVDDNKLGDFSTENMVEQMKKVFQE